MRFKIIGALVLIALVVVVSLQNNAPVELHFLFWNATIDRLLLFPALFLAGFFAGIFVFWARQKGKPAKGDGPHAGP